MRKINLSNSKKRDATLGFESKPTRPKIKQVLKDGSEKSNVKILKSTLQSDISSLSKKYSSLEDLGQEIIENDILDTSGHFRTLPDNSGYIFIYT